MKFRAGLLAVVAMAGCSGTAGAKPAPSHSAAASNQAGPLLVVATTLPGIQLGGPVPSPTAQTTVEIVDSRGRLQSSALFQPPPALPIGNAAPILRSPVTVVGGAVYYADSTGTVHRLLPNGSNSVVADFPLSGHQLLSYAVSPDGGRLIAIVLTVPPLHNPPPQDLTQPYFQEGAHWSLAVETASAGGSTQTTFTKDFGTNYPQPTLVAGWDSSGPVATTASCIGAQNPPQSVRMCGSSLIHIAPDGSHVDQIGGSDCLPLDELPDGTMLCATRVGTEVRRPSGETLWRVAWPDQNYYWGVSLSPDGNAVAAQDVVVSRSGVASAPRTRSPGNPSLVAEGWVDSSTVVEAGPNGQLELCPARDLARCESLGLSGIYEGVLQSRGR